MDDKQINDHYRFFNLPSLLSSVPRLNPWDSHTRIMVFLIPEPGRRIARKPTNDECGVRSFHIALKWPFELRYRQHCSV
ncbi:hypothetical protein IAS59_004025 [Cryptococcus gattii]